jgi:hypothetical protein
MVLEIDRIVRIEKLNHPDDHHIIFDGGHIVFNPMHGPVRFWYKGDLVVLNNNKDVQQLRDKFQDKNFVWEIDNG